MATKIIKAWINGAIQEIEVEDVISPAQPLSIEDRLVELEDKPVITDGNLLVGNGTTELEEMTPDEVLSHINGANVSTITTAEYEALDEFNANTLYMLTDAEDNCAYIDIEDNGVDIETGLTLVEVNEKVEELQETINNYQYELTEEEEQEIVDAVKTEVPLVKVSEQPTFVDSIDKMTDTNKTYVLSDGYLYAYMEGVGTEVLTSDSFTVGAVSTNGLQNIGSSSKNRIFTKILSLENSPIAVTCPENYNFLVYFYNTSSPTETNTTTLSKDLTGKTTWSSASWTDITAMNCTTGSMEGATHCRISFKHTSATDLSSYLEDFVNNSPVEIHNEGVKAFRNTGIAYNQPTNYEDRIIALENAFGGIVYGTY